MHELALLTVFMGGLLGSTHCVAMCGGIATAMGASRVAGVPRWRPLLYQTGRLLSYASGGATAGAIGGAVGAGLGLSHWGDILRLATALVVVVFGLDIALGKTVRGRWLRTPERLGSMVWRRLAPAASRSLPTSPPARALLLGMLWGWLPCGLVYSALVVAGVAGNAAGGAAVMVAFGLGTLPAMLGLSYLGNRLPRQGTAPARLLGAAIVSCGLWTAAIPLAALTGQGHHDHHAMDMQQEMDRSGGMSMPHDMSMSP
jgi:sulfite exporter TauE/SafE